MSTKKAFNWIHFFKIQPTHTVSFWLPDQRTPTSRAPFTMQNRKCNAVLSKKACFTWMQIISNKKKVFSRKEKKSFYFKLAFITLTLSDVQIHSDEYIKSHLLEPFLKWMYRSWNVNSYIWKAEVQNNGNIHFHITINKFIHWKSIRAKWNRLLSAHGYCKVYQDGTNDKGNAATEIKAVINEKEIASYIVGYVSKKDLFKKVKLTNEKKVKYEVSEKVELTNHYYLRENFWQVECSDGMIREYKRQIHGRLWSASHNLNESAIIINEQSTNYPNTSYVMNHPELCNVKEYDFHKVHLYKKKVVKYLEKAVRDQITERIHELQVADVKQTYIEVESLF